MDMRTRLQQMTQNTPARTPGVRIAIVDFGTGTNQQLLQQIALALTTQAQQHVALPPPFGFGLGACVRVAATLGAVQPNEWVLGLFTKPDQPGALGYHDVTPTGQPVMKVFPKLAPASELAPTMSHEMVETLADPIGASCVQAYDGRMWALEVADAVERDTYKIGAIPVSNFCLLPYFWSPANGQKLDFMGLCQRPLEIRPGGYGQWFDSQQGWQQVVHESVAPSAYRQAIAAVGRGAARRAMKLA